MKLFLEQLECRLLLAAPIKPFDLDLLAGSDSGLDNADDVTGTANATISLISETDSTVRIYNAGLLGTATGQNDTLFYDAGDIVVEAEKGSIAGNMVSEAVTGGYVGSGYVRDTGATPGDPSTGGSATCSFYIPVEDDYYVHGRVYYPDGASNSFFVNIDDQWDVGETGPGFFSNTFNSWHFNTVQTVVNGGVDQMWHLIVGWHTIEVHGRETDAGLDRFVISSNAAAPGGNGGAESITYETYQYTFAGGELLGSDSGTVNSITATAENVDGTSGVSDALLITFDNATYTPGSADLDSTSDTGSSNTDDVTNDTTATFTGQAGSVEGNAALWLRVGGVNKRTTTANADGSYSVTLQVGDLAEGANAVDIYYVDAAGNTSADSADISVTLDTTAAAPVLSPDLAAGSDTGLSNVDDYTNDVSPTFTGPAGVVPANSTVWLRVGGVNKQSTVAAGDGSYSITLAEGILAEGNNVIDIVYVDPANNTSSDSPDLTVNFDTVSNQPGVPDLTSDVANDTGSSQVDDITSNNNCEVSGSAEASSTVHIWVNGVEVNTVAANGAGNWSYSFLNGDLAEGANAITVTAVDSLSNPQGQHSNSLKIVLDTILATPAAPDLRSASDTGVSNTDNTTSDNAAWFDGYAEPGATVQIFVGAVGEGTATADASTGAWSIQLSNGDLADGANNITVQATDPAGNTATSPILVVTYDASGTVPNAPKLLATDDSGSSSVDAITNVTTAGVYGSVAGGNTVESNATVHVRTNKNAGGWIEVGTTVADSNGNWDYHFDGIDDLAVGTNLVDIYVTDLSNNDSSDSADLTITIDTSAAAPGAAPDLDSGSDTGSSNADDITTDTTPTFIGTAGVVEGNSTVYVRVDGSIVRSAAALANGSYSITLLVGDVTAGTHIIDIVYTDPAGNSSTDSVNLSFTLDTSAAAPASSPVLDSGSDTGDSNSDNLTNDTTATFTSLANGVEGNSTVCLRVGGVDTRTTTANADGSYSITLLAGDLAQGANVVDIYYTDPAGNTSADSADITVNLDTVIANPALPDLDDASDTGASNNDDITDETRPTISGIAGAVEADSTVRIWLDTPSDPDTQVGSVSAGGDGSWHYTFTSDSPLQEGDNIIHVIAVDPAGNTSNSSANLTVTVDFQVGSEIAPDLVAASDTGSSAVDNITYDTTATIISVCPSGAVVKIRTNESTIVTFTDDDGTDGDGVAGQWSYTYSPGDLTEGANTIDFLTIDTNNNTSTWSLDLVITLDTSIEQPTVPDLNTADDSGSNNADNITNDTTPTITGTAEANSTVTVDVNAAAHTDTVVAGADGTWSYGIANGWLNEGVNTIFVTATDISGNASVVSGNLSITLDTTNNAPSQPDLTAVTDTGLSNVDNITSHANPRIVGTAAPNVTITIRLDPNGAATTLGSTTADAGGNWSYIFATSVLSEGANEIDVVSTDIADNTTDSPELTITIETAISAPSGLDLQSASDLGDSNSDDITSLANGIIAGDADADCTIHVRVNGTEVGTAASNGAGNWSYTFDGVDDLIEGTNIIDAYAIDGVGNTSNYSADLIVVLDTTVSTPTIPDLTVACDTGTSDADNYTSDTNAIITGTCEAGATIIIHLNGVDNFDTVTDGNSDGIWSYTFAGGLNASATGTANTIKVAQQDVAGNVSAYGNILTITLDNAAQMPSLPDLAADYDTGDLNNDDLTNNPNVLINGTVEAGSSVQIFIDQGAGPVLIDTISEHLIDSASWSYTLSTGQLAQGSNDITVQATDKAGNVSAISSILTITFDTAIAQPGIPDLTAVSDTGDFDDDEVTSDETPTFVGTADANTHISIRVDGDTIDTTDADAAGNWTYTFTPGAIQTGVHRIDVIAVDASGNTSAASDDLTIWLNVQPTQPAAPNLQSSGDSGSIETDNITNITTPTIDGKADPDNTVYIYVDSNPVGTAIADADGFWQYIFVEGTLVEGNNLITIITEDSSGLQSSASYPLTITLDVTSPSALIPDLQAASDTGISNTDNQTADETATIEGEGEPGAFVDIYHNSEFLAQIPTNAMGDWTYTFAIGCLVEGDNNIYFIITDLADNVSLASPTLNIVFDVHQDSPDTPILSPETDTGSSNTDGLTNNSASDISGVVKAHSTVDILVSGNSVASVQADGQGDWEYTFQSGQLAEGLNHIEIISTDPVGNTARSATLDLELDTTAPIVYNYFPRGIYTHTTNSVELYINNEDINTVAAADVTGYLLYGSGGDGSFYDGNEWYLPISNISIDSVSGLVQLLTYITLTDDTYRLTIDTNVALHDMAGNGAALNLSTAYAEPMPESSSIVFTFEIDTAGPNAPESPQLDSDFDSGLDSTDNITNIASPLVHITATPEIAIEVICNGRSAGFANEIEAGQYQLYLDTDIVRDGDNLLLARAFDHLGNSSELSLLQSFTYDQHGPEVAAIVVDALWFNVGPTNINIVFEDSDVNPDSIESTDNFQLTSSGGDGTFGDGNETVIAPTSVTYDSNSQMITLTMPQTITGTSELTPDTYRLTVVSESTIADIAGNQLQQTSSQEFLVVPVETIHDNQRYRFTTDTGIMVTVALTGQGDVTILEGQYVGSDNVIEQIIVSNTVAKSTLRISSSSSEPITVGKILCESPLASLDASNTEITSQISIDQGLQRLVVEQIANGAQLNLSAIGGAQNNGTSGLRFYAGSIADNVTINIDGNLKLMQVAEFRSGAITADAIDKILVSSGNFGAHLSTTQGNLNSLMLRNGDLTGSVNIAGQLGNIKVTKGQVSSTITAQKISSLRVSQFNDAFIRSGSVIGLINAVGTSNTTISAGTAITRGRFSSDVTDTTIAAGTDISRLQINGDALDSLFLAGADLGADVTLGTTDDIFGAGRIALLSVRGIYTSTAAASIDPGVDIAYFTSDDSSVGLGSIDKIIFSAGSLAQTSSQHTFGLLATGSIAPFTVAGQRFEAPVQLDDFRVQIQVI